MLRKWSAWLFMAVEGILFLMILLAGRGHYAAIVLCFCFALLQMPKSLITAGLFFTVLADFCLVVCYPVERLWGMVFFLIAQGLYALRLHRGRLLLYLRLGLILVAETATVLVLGKNTDALALVSLCYYANLIMNIVCAFACWQESKWLPVALILFLLCDTVIGLQVMGSLYLPIHEGSILHSILYPGFDLAWFFYLPSQVLLALQTKIPVD